MRNVDKLLTLSVAAYNVEPYLEEAVLSCVEDEDPRLEIIIVNDGSTDDTISVAKALEAKYPETIRVVDKENGGYGSTVNTALGMARGVFFRYLDGDDWLFREAIKSFLDVLSTTKADAVYTPYIRCYESDGYEELVDPIKNITGVVAPNDLPSGICIAGCALAYRVSLLKDMAFAMSERRFYADIEFAYLPMTSVSAIEVTHIPLYGYRIGRAGQSVSLEGIVRHHDDMIKECEVLLENLTHDGEISSGAASDRYLLDCLAREVAEAIKFASLVKPSRALRAKLLEFDSKVEQCLAVYKASSGRSLLLRSLRATRYLILPLAHIHETRKMRARVR